MPCPHSESDGPCAQCDAEGLAASTYLGAAMPDLSELELLRRADDVKRIDLWLEKK